MDREFYVSLPTLGPEHAVSILILEYYNREIEPNKSIMLSDAQKCSLQDFIEHVYSHIRKIKNSLYIEYRDAIIIALNGDAKNIKDQEIANRIIRKTLRDQYLNRWFRSMK